MDKKAKIATVVTLAIVALVVLSVVLAAKGPQKACSDGQDNDGDTYTDWPNDPGCGSRNDNSELNPLVECDDGSDNDGDSNIDYPDDSGCSSPTDNDETDCGDSTCEGGEACDVCVADCGYCDSCSDTDGGQVPTVFGTVSGYYFGAPYSYSDYCVTSNSTTLLTEYYCNGTGNKYQYSYPYDCASEGKTCSGGACV